MGDDPKAELRRLIIMAMGLSPEGHRAFLRIWTRFDAPDAEEGFRYAESIDGMSDRWIETTLQKVKQAFRDHQITPIYDENGVKIQYDLFGGD